MNDDKQERLIQALIDQTNAIAALVGAVAQLLDERYDGEERAPNTYMDGTPCK